jgi:hypothetical protein
VVPILNLEKPTTLTVTLARGIYSALLRARRINWAILLHRNTQKWAVNLDSKKGCPLAPFLHHLYERHGCLTEEERKRLEIMPIPGLKSPAKRRAVLPGGGAGTSRPGSSSRPDERRMAPPISQPDRSSFRGEERRKDREDRPEIGQPGRANADSEQRTKRREDRREGNQQGGTWLRQDEQQRRKDLKTGQPSEARLQQELRTKRREDPEEAGEESGR